MQRRSSMYMLIRLKIMWQREAAERAKQALVAERSDKSLPVSIASGQHSDHLCMVAAYNMWSHLAAVVRNHAALCLMMAVLFEGTMFTFECTNVHILYFCSIVIAGLFCLTQLLYSINCICNTKASNHICRRT